MMKLSSFATVVFVCLSLFSCSLDSFDLDKLAVPTDIMPDVYAPLAYGTYKVDDLVSDLYLDDSVISSDGLLLSISLDKTGTSFRSSAVDSVYLMIHLGNQTSANMVFEMSFMNGGSRLYKSSLFPIESTLTKSFEIPLGPTEQDDLRNASRIELLFSLIPPSSTPLLYREIKDDSFSVQVSFHAPVDFGDL